jgi:hypothetical protein
MKYINKTNAGITEASDDRLIISTEQEIAIWEPMPSVMYDGMVVFADSKERLFG